MAPVLVNLSGVHFTYFDKPILVGLDWEIQAGQKIGLIGPNGAGKSTLLRLLHGISMADAGSIFRVRDLTTGYLPQDAGELFAADAQDGSATPRTVLDAALSGSPEIARLRRALDAAVFSVIPAADAIDEMVYKEEKILFPTALNLLTEQDWYQIYLQSDEYGYCLYAPEFVWQPEGGVQGEIGKPAAHDGRVQMPTGSFTLAELIGVFSTLPFDLTFVDADDTVRYFTPGKERIFDRSRAILGRKVQYCHPPKSVHVVNQIVRDFKAGKQDRARFWINLGGRLVYICYYAVRDEAGGYLGTLEVTQDLSEVRELTGERRLLSYDGDVQD